MTTSLRDQFAMAALQGEIAAQDFQTGDCWNLGLPEHRKQIAERCYLMADAMLVERNKTESVKFEKLEK